MKIQDAQFWADLLAKVAKGKTLQFQWHTGEWTDARLDDNFSLTESISKYRIKPESVFPKQYQKPLSEIDALEITRDMWKWLSEDITRTKLHYIKQFLGDITLLNYCSCCEFAGVNSSGYVDCSNCPLKTHWGSSNYSCDTDNADYMSWRDYTKSVEYRLAAALRISQAAEKRLAELKETVNVSKKQPTLRPWKPEEAPVGALIRFNPNSCIQGKYLILASDITGIVHSNTPDLCTPTLSKVCYKDLQNCEHSLDHGKTWLPCGVME